MKSALRKRKGQYGCTTVPVPKPADDAASSREKGKDMNRISYAVLLLAATIFATGCSMVAPKYTASLENVQKIKDSGAGTVKIGTFLSTPAKDNEVSISLRGSSMASPYGSYADYLAEALKQEFSLAGRLAPDAQVEVTGMLQKNDINIPPAGSGRGDIEARFVVTRAGTAKYDQVKALHDEWDSSFVGAVAIPRAQEKYPTLVQKLLALLYADPAFFEALK